MKKKKLVICASIFFDKEINEWKDKLDNDKYEVIKYPLKIESDFLLNYNKEFTAHYEAIMEADVLLAFNIEKNGKLGYIGAGVFAEISFAVGLNKANNKKIEVCYLNPIPENSLPYSDELKLWQDLSWIKLFDQ